MFLKSLELYGFKSFADKTRLEFADGTTSLLGPNGCGKSNIVDAIKWVLGEQSTRTLRAGKMEDVIFNGTETRKPLNVAEVTLVVNNEEGLLPVDHAEVEIKRRLFRTGESEFFINRNPVRLKDIRELFFDTGVGKSAYSILEQGKIDQILSHKPEDRRYIFEEAAGITRYKLRSQEAARKLVRTEENIDQVETLLNEIKRQYETRKAQAAKVVRYRELVQEQTALEVDVQLSAVKSFLLLKDARNEQLQQAKASYEEIKEAIAQQSAAIESEQHEVRKHAETRVAVQTRLQRLEEQAIAKNDQLELLQQRYHDFSRSRQESEGRSAQIFERIERDEFQLEEFRDTSVQLSEHIADLEMKIADQQELMQKTQQQIASHEQELEQREQDILTLQQLQEQLSVQLQELTDRIVVELDEKLKESGYSVQARKHAKQALEERLERIQQMVSQRKSFVETLAPERHSKSVSFDEFFTDLDNALQTLTQLFAAYEQTVPSFIDALLSPQGVITKKHEIDHTMSESRIQIARHREAITTLRDEQKGLIQLLDQYRERLTEQKVSLGEFQAKRDSLKTSQENLEKRITEQRYLYADAQRDAEIAAQRVDESVQQMADVRDEQQRIADEQESLEGQLAEIISVIEREQDRLSGERQKINQRYDQLNELRTTIDKYTFHIESIQEQIQGVYRTFFDTYGKSLKEYDDRLSSDLDDSTELRDRLAAVKKQIQSMGYINHMAEEEFAEIKERYEFLSQQMADLQKAKQDLTRVIAEIKTRSEQLFLDSYHHIRINFQQMFHRMFGGGRAELRLVDPDQVLESGIDILAQPPGKKLDRLDPLSGGEKALTAVALLFATYKVKPSPFCILDEIDAALDDRNIGYFLSVLEDFAKSSQFIIITHNKHTVMGSQTLLGVTMQERGVSKAISYRMGWESGQEVIHDVQVDTHSDNTV